MTRSGGSITTDNGDDRVPGSAVPPVVAPRWGSGRPRSMHARRPAHRSRLRLALRPLVLLPFAGLMMAGSLSAWITATYAGHDLRLNGTHHAISAAYGVNGWASFAAGAVLAGAALVLVGLRSAIVKLVAFLAAFAGLGVAVYSLVRILHAMSEAQSRAVQATDPSAHVLAGASIGYGLIAVVAAAFVGLLVSLTDLDSSR